MLMRKKAESLSMAEVMREAAMTGCASRLRLAGEDIGAEIAKELLADPEFKAEILALARELARQLREQSPR
jgi:hypothetical protein